MTKTVNDETLRDQIRDLATELEREGIIIGGHFDTTGDGCSGTYSGTCTMTFGGTCSTPGQPLYEGSEGVPYTVAINFLEDVKAAVDSEGVEKVDLAYCKGLMEECLVAV